MELPLRLGGRPLMTNSAHSRGMRNRSQLPPSLNFAHVPAQLDISFGVLFRDSSLSSWKRTNDNSCATSFPCRNPDFIWLGKPRFVCAADFPQTSSVLHIQQS